MNNSPLLQCTDVRKAFPKPDGAELLVLEGMNLELREGQIVGLLGRSGSGKSTLLRLIAGLAEPSAGGLHYLGKADLRVRRRASPWCSRVLRCFRGSPYLKTLRWGSRRSGMSAGGYPQTIPGRHRSDRLGRVRVRLSARAVGRHAAARRIRQGAGGASEYSADGRTVLRPGRADRGDAANRLPGSVGRRPDAHQGRHSGDAQHRRGGPDVRPHPGVRQQSGPDLE